MKMRSDQTQKSVLTLAAVEALIVDLQPLADKGSVSAIDLLAKATAKKLALESPDTRTFEE